jgi:integrase
VPELYGSLVLVAVTPMLNFAHRCMRDVAIPPHIRPMLKAHLKNHVGRAAESLLFADDDGTHLRSDRYRTHWEKARAAIGKPNLRVHDLRHVGTVLAAQSGATTAELMHRLGHTTPQMALRYQHVADEMPRSPNGCRNSH